MIKLIHTAMLACVATVGIAATPAAAQSRYEVGDAYYGRGYDRYDQRGYDNRRYDRGYDDRGYAQRSYDGRGYANDYRRNYQDCRRSSGSTGTIIGAIAGGLLGREIGRGGYRNRPSTTGLLLGAGAGALAGRAIDKSATCDRR